MTLPVSEPSTEWEYPPGSGLFVDGIPSGWYEYPPNSGQVVDEIPFGWIEHPPYSSMLIYDRAVYNSAGPGWITDPYDPRLVILWPGSDDYGNSLLFPLHVAMIQCERFAPALADGAPVPENYVAAQSLQARALVRAGIVGSGDQAGGYGETVAVFPMDWTVKNLLRPKKGRPYFGGARA